MSYTSYRPGTRPGILEKMTARRDDGHAARLDASMAASAHLALCQISAAVTMVMLAEVAPLDGWRSVAHVRGAEAFSADALLAALGVPR